MTSWLPLAPWLLAQSFLCWSIYLHIHLVDLLFNCNPFWRQLFRQQHLELLPTLFFFLFGSEILESFHSFVFSILWIGLCLWISSFPLHSSSSPLHEVFISSSIGLTRCLLSSRHTCWCHKAILQCMCSSPEAKACSFTRG